MPLTEQTIAWLRQAARLEQAGALADLDAIARLDALEARVASLEQRPIPGAVDLTAEADEPDDDAAQTLHTNALRIVDTTLAHLGVLPEILDTLRRAIREPMEPAAAAAPDTREPGCIMRWPDCYNDGYDPRCCRFPKSCSCGGYPLAASAPPAAAVAPVATDDELGEIWDVTHGIREPIRAIYNLGRAHGTPPAVVEALQEAEAVLTQVVESTWSRSSRLGQLAFLALPTIRAALQLLGEPAPAAPAAAAAPVTDVEACLVDQIRRHAPMAIGTAEAILYVVAAWLDRRGQHGCSLWLREQCAISQEEQGNG